MVEPMNHPVGVLSNQRHGTLGLYSKNETSLSVLLDYNRNEGKRDVEMYTFQITTEYIEDR